MTSKITFTTSVRIKNHFKPMTDKINLSEFLNQKLEERAKEINFEIIKPIPDVIVLVRCPYCRHEQEKKLFYGEKHGWKYSTCQECGRSFRVFSKTSGKSRRKPINRIVRPIKGSIMDFKKIVYGNIAF